MVGTTFADLASLRQAARTVGFWTPILVCYRDAPRLRMHINAGTDRMGKRPAHDGIRTPPPPAAIRGRGECRSQLLRAVPKVAHMLPAVLSLHPVRRL